MREIPNGPLEIHAQWVAMLRLVEQARDEEREAALQAQAAHGNPVLTQPLPQPQA